LKVIRVTWSYYVVAREEWNYDNIRRYISKKGGWTKELNDAKFFKTERGAKREANKYVHTEVTLVRGTNEHRDESWKEFRAVTR
jgi:hypothetical protein